VFCTVAMLIPRIIYIHEKYLLNGCRINIMPNIPPLFAFVIPLHFYNMSNFPLCVHIHDAEQCACSKAIPLHIEYFG
jgi:hypothetical protein